MNPVIEFYKKILEYLRLGYESSEMAIQTLQLAIKAKPACTWDLSMEKIKFLEECINRPDDILLPEDSQTYELRVDAISDFLLAAFRDLSILKNPLAMDLFCDLDREFTGGLEDFYVWARNVKERPDGSAVITLHVSSLHEFRQILEQAKAGPQIKDMTLEKGLIVTH